MGPRLQWQFEIDSGTPQEAPLRSKNTTHPNGLKNIRRNLLDTTETISGNLRSGRTCAKSDRARSPTGHSRGFAFVTMYSMRNSKGDQTLHAKLPGRDLTVNGARPATTSAEAVPAKVGAARCGGEEELRTGSRAGRRWRCGAGTALLNGAEQFQKPHESRSFLSESRDVQRVWGRPPAPRRRRRQHSGWNCHG